MHKYQFLLLMHKYVYHRTKLPSAFSTYFYENKLIRNNTQHKDDFYQGHLIQWAPWARAPNLQGAPRAAEVVIFFLAIM